MRMIKDRKSWLSLTGTLLLFAAPVLAADVPVPAKVHLVKQDKAAGYAGKQAKIVSKPLEGAFPLPSANPTAVGATLRFFRVGASGLWPEIDLPAAQWSGLGKPAGSKGYVFRGRLADSCRSVRVTPKAIKAVCTGPQSIKKNDPLKGLYKAIKANATTATPRPPTRATPRPVPVSTSRRPARSARSFSSRLARSTCRAAPARLASSASASTR